MIMIEFESLKQRSGLEELQLFVNYFGTKWGIISLSF